MHYWETESVVLLVSEAQHWYARWELMDKWALFTCHVSGLNDPSCHCLLWSSCSFLATLSSNFTVCSICRRKKHEGILAEGNLYTGLFVTEILLTSTHALLAFKDMKKSLVLNMNSILVSAYSKDGVPRWFTLITMNMRFIVNISAKHNMLK